MCVHNSSQSLLHYSQIIPCNKGLFILFQIKHSIRIGLQLHNLLQNSRTPAEF